MKLLKALELAEECGLETVDEAIRNVRIHSPSLFNLDEIDDEIQEMMLEWYRVIGLYSDGKLGIDRGSSVREVIDICRNLNLERSESADICRRIKERED